MQNSTVLLMKDGAEVTEGEIWISGPGLATGYLDDADLTASNFVQFRGERYYRTGDYAQKRYGRLLSLGRGDSVVKNRGFLVNLDMEVVPALLAQEGVQSAVALHHQGRLYGFITPASAAPLDIRASMQGQFDAFVVPDVIVPVERFALTHNGKIDLGTLRATVSRRNGSSRDWHPKTTTSLDALKYAVQSSLGLQERKLGNEDSFLNLGGNSLSAIWLLSILHNHNFSVSLSKLLSGADIKTTARCLLPWTAPAVLGEQPDNTHGRPVSKIQSEMLCSMAADPALYYMLIELDFLTDVPEDQEERLRSAWGVLFRRHPMLTCAFDVENLRYQVQSDYALDWKGTTQTHANSQFVYQNEKKALWCLAKTANASDPPTAFRFLYSPNRSDRLLWLVHHSRVDGVSVSILLAELQTLLNGSNLADASSFSDAARVQVDIAKTCSDEAGAFWDGIQSAQSETMPLNLPTPNTVTDDSDGHEVISNSEINFKRAEDICRSRSILVSTVVYAAWAKIISAYTSASTSSFGAVFSGRNLPMKGADTVVGPMISVCPFRQLCNHSVIGWLQDIHAQSVKTAEFQWSCPSSYNLLVSSFDTLVSIQYRLEEAKNQSDESAWQFEVTQNQPSAFLWTLLVDTHRNNLQFRLLYRPTLVSSKISALALEQFHSSFLALLDAIENSFNVPSVDFSWPNIPGRENLVQKAQSLWKIFFSTQLYWKIHVGLYNTKKSVEKDLRVSGDFLAVCEGGRVIFDLAVHYEAAWLLSQVEFQDHKYVLPVTREVGRELLNNICNGNGTAVRSANKQGLWWLVVV
jgi:hypothetical protein